LEEALSQSQCGAGLGDGR